MAPLINETAFIGIVGCMFVVLAGLSTLAKYNSRKRIKQVAATDSKSFTPGAKIIALPKNAMKAAKERFIIKESVSEEEIV